MIVNACLNYFYLLLFLIFSQNCTNSPKNSATVSIPIDTTLLINQILEKDNEKHIDTTKLVYELDNGEEYIKGVIIRRGKGLGEGDTIKLKSDGFNNYFITVPQAAQVRLTIFGTKVWLNAGTRLTVARRIKSTRYFKLEGEACFDVNENKDPLLIETRGGHRFIIKQGNIDINTFDDSEMYSASLNGGEAHLFCGDGQGKIKLNGYECISFGSNVLRQRKNADPTIARCWIDGFFAEDATLTSEPYFESIGRWYDVDVTFSKKSANYSFDGKMPMQSSLKSILKLLKYNEVKYKLKLKDNGKKLNIIFI